MSKIKTFEDACRALNLDPEKTVPDFSLFPETHRPAMEAHAKLVIIAEALNEGWVPDWKNSNEYKYYPWFNMCGSSGSGFSYNDYDNWNTNSNCSALYKIICMFVVQTITESNLKNYCFTIRTVLRAAKSERFAFYSRNSLQP